VVRKAADREWLWRNTLGVMYATAQGPARTKAQGGGWFRKAADQGLALRANTQLGAMHATDKGVLRTKPKRRRGIESEADQGLAEANTTSADV